MLDEMFADGFVQCAALTTRAVNTSYIFSFLT